MTTKLDQLPDNLPVPVDDGAADHLIGATLPDLELKATDGNFINFSKIGGRFVLYCYPMTGRPGMALPKGWDDIPGARGCTPQSCSFRDHHQELKSLGADVFGLSVQNTAYQKEMTDRLHLPFTVVSDENLLLTKALNLPTFSVEGMTLIKRITLVIWDTKIEAIHYPVFPSDSDPVWVMDYLQNHAM